MPMPMSNSKPPALTAENINRWHAWVCLAVAVVLSYANALSGDFQFDDYNVIVNNTSVHAWSAWGDFAATGIRPLLKLSYVLNWTSGWGVVGFHTFNVAVHLCNALLVLYLAQALVRAYGLAAPSQPQINAPLFAALLFAVHPAQTEAVSYICGRSTSLMALFYLAGVLAYVTSQHTSFAGTGESRRGQLLPPLCFALALSVKETAVTFPLALLMWELSCGTSLRAALRRQWTSWAMLLAGAVYFLLSERYLQHMQNSTQFNTMTGNAATQAIALVYLARQWAFPLWLNIDPDLAVQRDFSQALPALSFAALWFVAMVWCRRRRPWIGLALAWAFLHWVPLYLFLPRLDVANDRQLYLAIWPLCLAVAIELGLHLPRRLALGAAACLVVLFAALTVARNQDYRTEIAQWEATVALSPDKSRVHNNLGYAYRVAGRLQDARREYLVALHLDPGNVKARLNLRRLNLEQSLQGGEKTLR